MMIRKIIPILTMLSFIVASNSFAQVTFSEPPPEQVRKDLIKAYYTTKDLRLYNEAFVWEPETEVDQVTKIEEERSIMNYV